MSITLDDMAELARALIDADAEVKKADEALSAAKEKARMFREESIPSAMQELGLTELVMATGQKLKIQQDVYASIPAAGKAAAFKWLEDNGFGGLIKIEVTTEFGKGELKNAVAFFQELSEHGLHVEVDGEEVELDLKMELDQSVHAQTLKAFIREQLAKGANIPLEKFGARPVWTTKITNK